MGAALLVAVVALLSAIASLGAIALPIMGQAVRLIYIVGGAGTVLGLTAVVVSAFLKGRLIGFAGTSLFLAVAAVLLALGIDRSRMEAKLADELLVSAKTQEEATKKELQKFEDEKRESAAALKQAETLRAAAAEDRARVEDAPARAAKILEKAKVAEEKATALLKQVKAEQAKAKGLAKEEQAQLAEQREQTEGLRKVLAAEQAKVEETREQVAALAKQVEDKKAETQVLQKQADAERAKAKDFLDQATQKEAEAKKYLQKVEEALGTFKAKLKAKNSVEPQGCDSRTGQPRSNCQRGGL